MLEDRGAPLQQNSVNVTFLTSDINEETPQFSRSSYVETVLSTTPIGTSLLQVSARDEDGEDNIITYSIQNLVENDLNFTVDSQGVIRNDGLFPNVAEGQPQVYTKIISFHVLVGTSLLVYNYYSIC